MKVIIEITRPGSYLKEALVSARAVDRGKILPETDYHLGFENASLLFSELTPARLALLEVLKRMGAVSIYALAKEAQRNYSNVHADVQKLLDLDLITKDDQGRIFVPWDEVQIKLALESGEGEVA